MKENGTTIPKYQPLRVLWYPFMLPYSKYHSLGTNSPVYLLTRSSAFRVRLIKCFLQPITFLCMHHFSSFFSLFLSFSLHTFSWVCRSFREPQKFFSFCAFTCLSNNSLSEFQPNLCQDFSHACSACHTIL